MDSLRFINIFELYQRVLSVGVLEYLQQQAGMKVRRSVYSAQVVLWMMILQRLHSVGTLAAAVQLLIQGAADPLLQNCRRVRTRASPPEPAATVKLVTSCQRNCAER